MYSSMFQGQNTSSFGAADRAAYVASLKRIIPKGKLHGERCCIPFVTPTTIPDSFCCIETPFRRQNHGFLQR